MQFVHELFDFGFYFLNLLGKHADKSNGMLEFQRLGGHETSNGRRSGVSDLNSLFFLVMTTTRFWNSSPALPMSLKQGRNKFFEFRKEDIYQPCKLLFKDSPFTNFGKSVTGERL